MSSEQKAMAVALGAVAIFAGAVLENVTTAPVAVPVGLVAAQAVPDYPATVTALEARLAAAEAEAMRLAKARDSAEEAHIECVASMSLSDEARARCGDGLLSAYGSIVACEEDLGEMMSSLDVCMTQHGFPLVVRHR